MTRQRTRALAEPASPETVTLKTCRPRATLRSVRETLPHRRRLCPSSEHDTRRTEPDVVQVIRARRDRVRTRGRPVIRTVGEATVAAAGAGAGVPLAAAGGPSGVAIGVAATGSVVAGGAAIVGVDVVCTASDTVPKSCTQVCS